MRFTFFLWWGSIKRACNVATSKNTHTYFQVGCGLERHICDKQGLWVKLYIKQKGDFVWFCGVLYFSIWIDTFMVGILNLPAEKITATETYPLTIGNSKKWRLQCNMWTFLPTRSLSPAFLQLDIKNTEENKTPRTSTKHIYIYTYIYIHIYIYISLYIPYALRN